MPEMEANKNSKLLSNAKVEIFKPVFTANS